MEEGKEITFKQMLLIDAFDDVIEKHKLEILFENETSIYGDIKSNMQYIEYYQGKIDTLKIKKDEAFGKDETGYLYYTEAIKSWEKQLQDVKREGYKSTLSSFIINEDIEIED